MNFNLKRTKQFKKDINTVVKRGCDLSELEKVVQLLINGDTLPEAYKDHPLHNTKKYKNCRELHIKPDWLLIYKYYNDELILMLFRTGSHSDLF